MAKHIHLQAGDIVERGFFFSSRRRHTRFDCDWSSDVCSSDLQSLPKLCRDVIGSALPDDDPDKTKLAMFVFAALRGMAIDQGHVAALPTTRPNPAGDRKSVV